MTKKILMIFLFLVFILGSFLLFKFFGNKISPQSISVPLPKTEPQSVTELTPSPTPGVAVNEVENDLLNIEADLKKVKGDTRLDPPSFIFNLGIFKLYK